MNQWIEKIDLTKKYADVYTATPKQYDILSVPELQYLCVSGQGYTSQSDAFDEATKMIYGIAFTLKLWLKRNPPAGFFDYVMPPMEALWWDMDKPKEEWKRKALLLQPNYITESMVVRTMEIAKSKNQDQSLPKVTLQSIKQHTVIQTLHVWPYVKIKPTITQLSKSAVKQGYTMQDKHHEIYINDWRRTPAEKLQTIIRYQVKKSK